MQKLLVHINARGVLLTNLDDRLPCPAFRRTLGEIFQIGVVLAGGLWRTVADPNELESALLNLGKQQRADALDSQL